MVILPYIFKRKMSQNVSLKLLNNAEAAEKRISELKSKLEVIKKQKVEEKIKQVTAENDVLAKKVKIAIDELTRLEILNGKKQYSLPAKALRVGTVNSAEQTQVKIDPQDVPIKKEKKEQIKKEKSKEKVMVSESNEIVDVRKLDFRIGKIVDINKHPDADSLYVEQIDCGEEKPRTVVSGLVNHVPIEEMRNRVVMILCNLKPAKMRGVLSEAMVMCASSPEKVEVLIPPSGAGPGDLVTCEGYPREPEAQLNPKKKIFETCAPDLKTNSDKVACFRGNPLVVSGKGPIVAATLKDVNVK